MICKTYFLLLIVVLALLTASSYSKPMIICTTTVLASIVRDLANGRVEIYAIAPPSVCPAHYDVRPSDLSKVARANLIFYHGFEPWVKEIAKASGSRAILIKVSGPWNTPSSLSAKYIKMAKALAKYLHSDFNSSLTHCLYGISKVDNYLKNFSLTHGFKGLPTVCALFQKPFLEYLGFRCIATYGPPEMVSLRTYLAIVANATKFHAVLVVDNLQSGTQLGKKIADALGIKEVALTNFPWVTKGLNNMTSVMIWNAKLLAKALTSKGRRG
ncbi:MAG: hypothetical protein B6U69_03080 [Thermofilum sp. ex4484_15]|nr:MAG: hypothetical protein B6U69_03080 [Thermofilum sp. ex4484_15]